jgi:triacylglycerol lipase
MIGAMAALTSPNDIYDFKLDQFGLSRRADESSAAYQKRVWNSSIWEDNKDLANWDLTVAGAKWVNSWTPAMPDVYYFSWGTEATFKGLLTRHEIPIVSMNPAMSPLSTYIGCYTRNVPGLDRIDSTWWKNDGLVPLVSQNGPKLGSSDSIVDYSGTPQIGVWNFLGTMNRFDHGDIIGLGTVWDPRPWYRDQASLLASLPD